MKNITTIVSKLKPNNFRQASRSRAAEEAFNNISSVISYKRKIVSQFKYYSSNSPFRKRINYDRSTCHLGLD